MPGYKEIVVDMRTGAFAMTLISSLAAVIAPVILVTLVGYGWGRMRESFDHVLVTRLVTLVASPALVFSTLATMTVPEAELASMAEACLVCLILFAAIGIAVLTALRLPIRVYLPSLMFPNIGNMGLPVCLFAFGQTGLALAMIYFAVTAIGQFTLGPAIAAGRLQFRALLRVPFLYAVAVSLLINGLGLSIPKWLDNTTTLVAGMAIPLMLLSLGVALADLRAANIRRAVGMSVLRLGMGFAGGWAVAALFGFEGAARGVLVIQSSMPVAVFNFLFARLYDNSPEEVAGMVMVSTLLCYALLPLVVAMVM